jgi:ribosome-associated translation inhibitor RaiA
LPASFTNQIARDEVTISMMRRSSDGTHNPLGEYVLHMGVGFVAKERPHVLEALAALEPHLGHWNPLDISLEVSLQDRGRKEQRVTLRTTLPGLQPLVAVADSRDITRALHEAKHELIRQIEHQKSAREPMHNRKLGHDTIRHPGTSAQHRIPPAP